MLHSYLVSGLFLIVAALHLPFLLSRNPFRILPTDTSP